jgi:hypothetical protein
MNKLGTEHPKTGWNTGVQALGKSMRGKDGRLFCAAHNPTAVGKAFPRETSECNGSTHHSDRRFCLGVSQNTPQAVTINGASLRESREIHQAKSAFSEGNSIPSRAETCRAVARRRSLIF